MVHRPEKILQIGVHDPLPTARDLLPNFAHGILRRSPSPISEVGFIQHRLEDRFQPIEQRLLAHPVINRRDSPRAKLASPGIDSGSPATVVESRLPQTRLKTAKLPPTHLQDATQ